ncbi:MAG: MtrB/PioB family outer membrane beta-barrel protein [Dokdonella sp.]|uniref:MtrB/PioB family outer membrane beta-barrel protein n=1 Tax=Dokdonella sp. TaxID=2291710 RepID=UPI003263E4E3
MRHHPSVRSLSSASFVLGIAAAFAARADSGVGVDTWRANKLDPAAGATALGCDERGTSWLVEGQHRSPTGNLYACPPPSPQPDEHGDWQGYGVLQIGALGTSGDDGNALFNRYVDWDSGLILGLLDYTWERPADGTYANVRASHISDDDEYYQATFGRAGSYKIQAFLRDMPNVLSNNAKPIWNGVGTNRLTLPSSLVAGASTAADVAAVSAATPERRLSVRREKQGVGVSMYLTPQWTWYANVTDEERKGARPYGGPFFFNYPFADDGGVLETTKPIDDATINLNGGLRYAGTTWRMDLGYSGSFYRDRYTRYTYETPFALYPVVPDAVSAPLTTGQMATEPDNDYHNLKAAFTRKLPLNGELSLTASAGRMSQNDALIAPIDCQGVFGIGLNGSLELGPQNPFLYDCSKWNTTASLSRPTSDMRIDTTLVDARIVLQPTSDWTLRGGVRLNREDYRNTYLAYNPLTGQYGYVSENGAQGSVVPGESGIFDPLAGASAITRVSSLPLDMQTEEASVGADWKIGAHDTLGATYTFNRYAPTNRERGNADDNSVKVTWVNRSLDWLTFRANATVLKQTGDRYNDDPYGFTYSIGLPGFVPPSGGVPAHTVDALRKYDLASRDERKINLMATVQPRDDMTISASVRGDWNDYDAELGRQAYNTLGMTLQWEWQPSTRTNASLYYGYDRSGLRLANVNELNASGSDPSLGGSTYPELGRWWADDRQRNHNAGATLAHDIGRVRVDANWNMLYSRGTTAYTYASSLAPAYPDPGVTGAGGGAFPSMIYRVNTLNLGITVPLMERISLRLFDIYERGHISDWHYLGFDATRVFDHRVYTDGGPESYDANLIGLLVTIRL